MNTTAVNPTPELAPVTASPGHTVGPFFHNALGWASAGSSADDPALGTVRIEGAVETVRASGCRPGWSRPGCRRPPKPRPAGPRRAFGG